MQMVKLSGSANYNMPEVVRLLDLVEEYLPLGKDEWERTAAFYNSTRHRGWPGRNFESLRRKFKVLYSTHKPTGTPEMPPHIKRTKELKEAIDEKANVVVMDGGEVEPDFCFNVDPDDDDFAVSDDLDDHADDDSTRSLPSDEPASQTAATSGCADMFVAGTYLSSRGHFQDLLSTTSTNNDLANYPSIPLPTPLVRAPRTTRASARKSPASPTSGVSQTSLQQQPLARLRGDQADDTRWLHRICQSAASQHPPERGESDWSGSLAHGDMRPVVQE
jgi:hypothetical protein